MGRVSFVWFGLDGVLVNHQFAIERAISGEWWELFAPHRIGGIGQRERQRSMVGALLSLGARFGLDGELEEILSGFGFEGPKRSRAYLIERFRDEYMKHLAVYGDVPPLFFLVGSKIQLGVTSRGARSLEEAKLMRLGLSDRFAMSMFEAQVTRGGELSLFTRWVEQCALPPREIFFVGSDLNEDVEAARRCGLRAVWLNRYSSRRAHDIPTVHSLDELVCFFDEWVGETDWLSHQIKASARSGL